MAEASDPSAELWSARAHRMQPASPMAAFSGQLTLTATKLRYDLGRRSRLLGSRLMGLGTALFGAFASEDWATPIGDIARIDVVDRTPMAPGGPRRFLRVQLRSGHEELFRTDDLETKTAAALRQALQPYRRLE